MPEYELAVLLHPDLEIDQAKPLSKIEQLISSGDGTIVARDDWGKRKLAYPIKKQQYAIYYFYRLTLPTTAVAELERNLSIASEVLRHLLVKAAPPAATAAAGDSARQTTPDAANETGSRVAATTAKPAANSRPPKVPSKTKITAQAHAKEENLPAKTSATEKVKQK